VIRIFLAAAALVAATMLAAEEETLSADQFDDLTRGRTLQFNWGGKAYGAEQFFDGRRSVWRYADGSCDWGQWRERDGLICFTYESALEEQCWRVSLSGQGLEAELFRQDAPTGFVVTTGRRDSGPLPCPGPRVGS
jgi:hypothetical protein